MVQLARLPPPFGLGSCPFTYVCGMWFPVHVGVGVISLCKCPTTGAHNIRTALIGSTLPLPSQAANNYLSSPSTNVSALVSSLVQSLGGGGPHKGQLVLEKVGWTLYESKTEYRTTSVTIRNMTVLGLDSITQLGPVRGAMCRSRPWTANRPLGSSGYFFCTARKLDTC